MKAEILCVGTELLLGDIVNTNAAFIARELAAAGVEVYHQAVVGDNDGRLRECLSAAFSRSDTVILTGGLGPTYDDMTKETVARYFGRPLETHAPSLARIRAFFDRLDKPMTLNNEKQALMPAGATVFPNENGTAPGLAVGDETHTAILLPGPPREMEPMFVQQVMPYLAGRTGKTICSRTLHIFGMGESQLEDLLREQMLACTNPTIAPYAKEGEVQLRVTAMAASPAAARALTDPVVDGLCARLGDVVYGVDVGSLEHALVQALRARGERVAVAESCSGGLLAKRITDVPGSSEVFDCGVVSYANAVKHRLLGVREETLASFGAVSPQTASEMAAGVRRLAGADYGLSTTGIAGPGGGSEAKPVGLVYVGVATPDGVETLELHLRRGYQTDRSIIRRDAASHALAALLHRVRGL